MGKREGRKVGEGEKRRGGGERDVSKSLYMCVLLLQLLYSYMQDGVCVCVSFPHLQEVTWARM